MEKSDAICSDLLYINRAVETLLWPKGGSVLEDDGVTEHQPPHFVDRPILPSLVASVAFIQNTSIDVLSLLGQLPLFRRAVQS